MKSTLRPSSLAIAVLTFVVGLLLQTVFHERASNWKHEGGPFETASVVFLALAFLIAAFRLVRRPSAGWLAGSLMLLWSVLRELDFQKAFTYRSIESLGFYTRPIAPLWQKAVAIVVLIPFVVAAGFLLRLLWRQFRSGRWYTSRWVGHFLAAAALLVVAQTGEKIFGFDILEETCEAGMALVIALLVWDASKEVTEKP